MKIKQATFVLTAVFSLGLLSSCGLVRSIAKIPAGIVKTAVRTAGVSNLTDHHAQPVEPRRVKGLVNESPEPAEGSAEPLAE